MTSASARKLNEILKVLGEEYTFTGKVNINGTEGIIFKNKIRQSYIKINHNGVLMIMTPKEIKKIEDKETQKYIDNEED